MKTDTDLFREGFARVLRRRRHELDLSQEELGHRAGLTMRYISLLECNKRQPTISTLFSLSQALNVPLSDFIREVEDGLS